MLQNTPPASPLRVVVNMTDGNIHSVFSDHPVEVVFFSYSHKDVAEHGQGFTDPSGKPVALWMDGSEYPTEDAATVDWFFDQYKGCTKGARARQAAKPKRPPMNRIQQDLHTLIETLRDCSRPGQDVRERSAEVISAMSEIHGMLSDEEGCSDLWDAVGGVLEQHGVGLLQMDHELEAEGLNDKYSAGHAWGEHPKYPREDWQTEVANGDTQGGYWEWVSNMVANHE